MKYKIVTLCAIALSLSLLLSSCIEASAPPPLSDAIAEFSDRYGSLPPGRLYLSKRSEWEEGFFSGELRASLFGRDPSEAVGGDIEFGVWLGSASSTVAEFGIFICANRSDAEIVSELCLTRIDRLRSPMYGNVDVGALNGAFVMIGGSVVIYAVLPDADGARRAANAVL